MQAFRRQPACVDPGLSGLEVSVAGDLLSTLTRTLQHGLEVAARRLFEADGPNGLSHHSALGVALLLQQEEPACHVGFHSNSKVIANLLHLVVQLALFPRPPACDEATQCGAPAGAVFTRSSQTWTATKRDGQTQTLPPSPQKRKKTFGVPLLGRQRHLHQASWHRPAVAAAVAAATTQMPSHSLAIGGIGATPAAPATAAADAAAGAAAAGYAPLAAEVGPASPLTSPLASVAPSPRTEPSSSRPASPPSPVELYSSGYGRRSPSPPAAYATAVGISGAPCSTDVAAADYGSVCVEEAAMGALHASSVDYTTHHMSRSWPPPTHARSSSPRTAAPTGARSPSPRLAAASTSARSPSPQMVAAPPEPAASCSWPQAASSWPQAASSWPQAASSWPSAQSPQRTSSASPRQTAASPRPATRSPPRAGVSPPPPVAQAPLFDPGAASNELESLGDSVLHSELLVVPEDDELLMVPEDDEGSSRESSLCDAAQVPGIAAVTVDIVRRPRNAREAAQEKLGTAIEAVVQAQEAFQERAATSSPDPADGVAAPANAASGGLIGGGIRGQPWRSRPSRPNSARMHRERDYLNVANVSLGPPGRGLEVNGTGYAAGSGAFAVNAAYGSGGPGGGVPKRPWSAGARSAGAGPNPKAERPWSAGARSAGAGPGSKAERPLSAGARPVGATTGSHTGLGAGGGAVGGLARGRPTIGAFTPAAGSQASAANVYLTRQ